MPYPYTFPFIYEDERKTDFGFPSKYSGVLNRFKEKSSYGTIVEKSQYPSSYDTVRGRSKYPSGYGED